MLKLPHKAKILLIFSLTIMAMLLLAGGIADILSTPAVVTTTPSKESNFMAWLIALFNRGQTWFLAIFVVLFGIAIISIFFTRSGRKWFAWIMLFLALLVLLAFLQSPQKTVKPTPTLEGTPLTTVDPTAEVTPMPTGSSLPAEILPIADWFVTLMGVFLAILLVGVIALLFFLASRRRPITAFPEAISQEAQLALDALDAGGDFQDTVIRCYVQMSRILEEQRNLKRDTAMTPREFERILIRIGFPADAVLSLTRLFEAVRYGTFHPDAASIQSAINSLEAIVKHSKAMDAPTGS
jgi:hypothetical protein